MHTVDVMLMNVPILSSKCTMRNLMISYVNKRPWFQCLVPQEDDASVQELHNEIMLVIWQRRCCIDVVSWWTWNEPRMFLGIPAQNMNQILTTERKIPLNIWQDPLERQWSLAGPFDNKSCHDIMYSLIRDTMILIGTSKSNRVPSNQKYQLPWRLHDRIRGL